MLCASSYFKKKLKSFSHVRHVFSHVRHIFSHVRHIFLTFVTNPVQKTKIPYKKMKIDVYGILYGPRTIPSPSHDTLCACDNRQRVQKINL